MLTKALLLICIARADAQSCYATSCGACLAPTNVGCEWCASAQACEVASPFSPCAGAALPVTDPSACPAPVAPDSALTVALRHARPLGALALAAPALLLLFVFACTPAERACGIRAPPAAPAHRPAALAVGALFAASAALWVGSLLFAVSPSLLSVVAVTVARDDGSMSYAAASASLFYQCAHRPGDGSDLCDLIRSTDYVDASSDVPTQVVAFVDAGAQIAVAAYAVVAALLFLPALMTGVATVRVSNLRRYGVPAYLGGCSPASLPTALAVGWTGFVVAAVVLAVAENTASRAADYGAAQMSFSDVKFLGMPGLLAMGASVALLGLGLGLATAASCALARVEGVGCNGGGCCRLRLDVGAPDGGDEGAPRYAPHAEPLVPAAAHDEAAASADEEPPRAPRVPLFTRAIPKFITTVN